jgi:hypothetical protein
MLYAKQKQNATGVYTVLCQFTVGQYQIIHLYPTCLVLFGVSGFRDNLHLDSETHTNRSHAHHKEWSQTACKKRWNGDFCHESLHRISVKRLTASCRYDDLRSSGTGAFNIVWKHPICTLIASPGEFMKSSHSSSAIFE